MCVCAGSLARAHAFATAGAQALAHKDDQQLIENIEGYRDRYQAMMPFLTEEDFHSCKVTQWLKQGDSFNALGKKFEVLVEGYSKRSKSMFKGRNSQNKMVVFEAKGLIPGQYVEVVVEDCTSATLIGRKID